jgi:hypothetical protein
MITSKEERIRVMFGQTTSYPTIADFAVEIQNVLAMAGANEYGDTARPIYRALGPAAAGYAVAEKGLRYGRKGNPVDLVKAAAYAYLAWSATPTTKVAK